MNTLTTSYLRQRMNAKSPVSKGKGALDSVNGDDDELMGAAEFTIADITMAAAAAIQQWVETDDLDEGESIADRLLAQMIGIADANKDGEITEDEQDVLSVALSAAYDYMVGKGVSEEDADALLNDWDGDVAERVRDLIASVLPEGDDQSGSDLDNFVFGESDQEPALDAVYKKVFAIRKGKKVKIRKRISGTVRLTAKQKVSIRKAQMKSHSATARMRRAKSIIRRTKMGLK